MKSKQLLSTLLFLFAVTFSFAQVSFTQSGIAVQGIARDANNTAIQNQNITMEFEFYYFNDSNDFITIGSIIPKQVVTDNFGVFSTIVDPKSANNQVFSNFKVWLRIKKQGDSSYLSESPLNHVPYAISANNGVPTGTVMPYMGKVAPVGWLMCDGQTIIPDGPLKTLLIASGINDSSKTPNLNGMFLRGSGTNSLTEVTTALGGRQDDAFARHLHNARHNHGLNDPKHGHGIRTASSSNTGSSVFRRSGDTDSSSYPADFIRESSTGITISQYTGDTANTGSVETRPVNYGVNYIIKL